MQWQRDGTSMALYNLPKHPETDWSIYARSSLFPLPLLSRPVIGKATIPSFARGFWLQYP